VGAVVLDLAAQLLQLLLHIVLLSLEDLLGVFVTALDGLDALEPLVQRLPTNVEVFGDLSAVVHQSVGIEGFELL